MACLFEIMMVTKINPVREIRSPFICNALCAPVLVVFSHHFSKKELFFSFTNLLNFQQQRGRQNPNATKNYAQFVSVRKQSLNDSNLSFLRRLVLEFSLWYIEHLSLADPKNLTSLEQNFCNFSIFHLTFLGRYVIKFLLEECCGVLLYC